MIKLGKVKEKVHLLFYIKCNIGNKFNSFTIFVLLLSLLAACFKQGIREYTYWMVTLKCALYNDNFILNYYLILIHLAIKIH